MAIHLSESIIYFHYTYINGMDYTLYKWNGWKILDQS